MKKLCPEGSMAKTGVSTSTHQDKEVNSLAWEFLHVFSSPKGVKEGNQVSHKQTQ
jgi:hypothetical protein